MSPEQLSALTALLTLVGKIGFMPLMSSISVLVLSPWVVLVVISFSHSRRFEAVVKMYENNFAQTEEVIGLANGFKDMSKSYHESLVWATQGITEAKEMAENNLYCPVVRKNANPKDI